VALVLLTQQRYRPSCLSQHEILTHGQAQNVQAVRLRFHSKHGNVGRRLLVDHAPDNTCECENCTSTMLDTIQKRLLVMFVPWPTQDTKL
jgi:hypothetical protein